MKTKTNIEQGSVSSLVDAGMTRQAMRQPKMWRDKPRQERARILSHLNYSFADMLSTYLWDKLPKKVREDFKKQQAENNI